MQKIVFISEKTKKYRKCPALYKEVVFNIKKTQVPSSEDSLLLGQGLLKQPASGKKWLIENDENKKVQKSLPLSQSWALAVSSVIEVVFKKKPTGAEMGY